MIQAAMPWAPTIPWLWYHLYDGGRAFYTELGHTQESFAEVNYLKPPHRRHPVGRRQGRAQGQGRGKRQVRWRRTALCHERRRPAAVLRPSTPGTTVAMDVGVRRNCRPW